MSNMYMETDSVTRKSLRDRAAEFSVQLPFMEGKEKGDVNDILNEHLTIIDYGFLTGKEGNDYVVFIVKEYAKKFFFGGAVLTDQMQQLEAEGYRQDILEEGLPMIMIEKKSRNNRKYINVEFYPA